MTWEQVVDTVLNLEIFAFVGVMVWLYFKETPEEDVAIEPLEGSDEPSAVR